LVAVISGLLFVNLLHINWLWFRELVRCNGLWTKLLVGLGAAAVELGATRGQLDTLDFQAKPFYEKHGYQVKYQLNNYPRTGTRYFMEKSLI